MISRKLYDFILQDTSIIYPQFVDGVFYDSFSYVEKVAANFSKKILSTNQIEELVEHFFSSSFNYGMVMHKKTHEKPRMIYEREFT
jgi:hypothetical protein